MNRILKIIALFLLSIMLFKIDNSTLASEKEDEIGFTAQAILEEHQTMENIGYWWLNVTPGEVVHIKLKVTNGKHHNTFEMSSNQAVTNSNLVVDYTQNKEKLSSFLSKESELNFYEDVKFGLENKKSTLIFDLKPNETVEIPISISIPSSGILGQAVGGINIKRKPHTSEREKGLLNIYNYAFALVLNGDNTKSKNLKIVPDEITTNKQMFMLENPAPVLIKDVSIKIQIKDEEGTILADLSRNKGTVVPNANIPLSLNTKTKLKHNSTYHMTIEMKEGVNKKETHYQLKVNNEGEIKIKEINKNDTSKPLSYLRYISLGIISVAVMIIFLSKQKKGKSK